MKGVRRAAQVIDGRDVNEPGAFMTMLIGPDFPDSALAKMEPKLPFEVHNCVFPSEPFREGLQLEWSPSQWHR